MSNNIQDYQLWRIKKPHLIIGICFLTWIALYFFSEIILYSLPPSFSVENIKEKTDYIKVVLNFLMAFVVLCITFADRYEKITKLRELVKEDDKIAKFRDEINKLFVPFIISIVPFTSAAMDAGALFNSPIDTVFFIILAFIGITLVDISALFKIQKTENISNLIKLNFFLYLVLTVIEVVIVNLF
ncbi:hypothetical protein E2R52_12200 [Pantoea ananatis]|uniref:hypothetical protein n=1 Tax=Pantoea ananas TaxID=553 RepID=UPI001059FC67|nr:hypothetical protein [Pantoea ananatis]TDL54733.1 hypothetical protein E2R52_12200 [Pantoea ananatis]